MEQRSFWRRLGRLLRFRWLATLLRGGEGMQDRVPTLTERLRDACEEADLLAWYLP